MNLYTDEVLVNLVYHFVIPQGTMPWQPIKVTQVALLWQRDRATRLSVEILQLTKHPI